MQVHPLGIGLDLDNLMRHLLVTVVNIYGLLLGMQEQLPDLHGQVPQNIWR